jgi:hypothetical protein
MADPLPRDRGQQSAIAQKKTEQQKAKTMKTDSPVLLNHKEALKQTLFALDSILMLSGSRLPTKSIAELTKYAESARASLDQGDITEAEEARRGELMAGKLHLRKSDGVYRTEDGTKTALGLYRTLKRYVTDGE